MIAARTLVAPYSVSSTSSLESVDMLLDWREPALAQAKCVPDGSVRPGSTSTTRLHLSFDVATAHAFRL